MSALFAAMLLRMDILLKRLMPPRGKRDRWTVDVLDRERVGPLVCRDRTFGGLLSDPPPLPQAKEIGNALRDLADAAGGDAALAQPLAFLLTQDWLSMVLPEAWCEDEGPNVCDPLTGEQGYGYVVRFRPYPYTPAWLNPLRKAASLEEASVPFSFGRTSVTIDGNTKEGLDEDFVTVFRELYEAGGEWVLNKVLRNLLGLRKNDRLDRIINRKHPALTRKYIQARQGRPGGYRFVDPNGDAVRPRSSVEANLCER